VAAAAILTGLYRFLKNKSEKFQTAVLFACSCTGLAAIVYNLLRWDNPLAYLPLHLCSLNAMVLPAAVLTKNKRLCNLLLVWCLGALVALIANFEMMHAALFGEAFVFYYFPHVFEFGIPVLPFRLGLVKKDPGCIGSTLCITMGIYTLVHLCNVAINHFCMLAGNGIRVNYMFSVEASNPLVALFYRLIPYDYWHMYLALPIVAVYLLIVYAPELMGRYRQKHLRRKFA
jgi:uncharacterized membrane protein YwaF